MTNRPTFQQLDQLRRQTQTEVERALNLSPMDQLRLEVRLREHTVALDRLLSGEVP